MKRIPKRKRRGQANNIYPNSYLYIYIGPAVALLVALCLFPLLVLFYNSFTDLSMVKPETHFAGIQNLKKYFLLATFESGFGRRSSM